MPHCIPTLPTPCHCERIDMSHRLIHARPKTGHRVSRVEILHISKEKRARKQTRRSGAIWGKMLRMRRTQFSDRVHICAKWRRRRLSTTETRRDLVKLFSAGESLSPVPGFGRGSCVPPDPRSNMLRDPSSGWVPQSFMSRCPSGQRRSSPQSPGAPSIAAQPEARSAPGSRRRRAPRAPSPDSTR